jgi:threonine 3-dehydrogenase
MTDKMKAIMKSKAAPGAELTTVDIPTAGEGQILAKVKATSICGTDVHIYKWDKWAQSRIKVPRVFGHEFTGEVIELGKGVKRIKVGDLISAETHIGCGICYQCRTGNAHICENMAILGVDIDGCFAEYVAIPEENAWKVSPALPVEIASMLEPMGNAVHTVFAANIPTNKVAVIGCGPIGLGAIGVVKAAGAVRIFATDINEYRLAIAKKMGADVVINAEKDNVVETVLTQTEGRGVDVVLELSGSSSAIREGFKILRYGGTMSMLGLPSAPMELDINNFIIFKAATVIGISGRRMFSTWYQLQNLLDAGLFDPSPIITHKMKLEEFEQAMTLIGSGNSGKVVLFP